MSTPPIAWWLLAAVACGPVGAVVEGPVPDTGAAVDTPGDDTGSVGDTGPAPGCTSDAGRAMDDRLTEDFRAFLASDPRFEAAWAREDLTGGSFGGFVSDGDCARRRPVVFVHGNGDRALGGPLGGWATVRSALLDAGWRSAELYATTYGPADPLQVSAYQHDEASLSAVRGLMEAVLAYTGAARIDVVGHSLGVTMARRAILGGRVADGRGGFDLGPPLTDRVHTFVGLAGANLGLASCASGLVPVCDDTLGLFPGVAVGTRVEGRSQVLQDMVDAPAGFEGARRYTVWSDADEVVGFGCIVWGRNTCRIPGQTGERRARRLDHLGVRDETTDTLIGWLQED